MPADDDHALAFDDFLKVEMHTGTVTDAWPNPKARVPAYVLTIDFGPLGIKQSSAQLTENYRASDLVGRQIVAVTNFPSKRIAGIRSEVLVLGAVCDAHGVVLLEPTFPVRDGSRIR